MYDDIEEDLAIYAKNIERRRVMNEVGEAEFPKEIYEFDFEGKRFAVYVLTEDQDDIDPSERFVVQIKDPEGRADVAGDRI